MINIIWKENLILGIIELAVLNVLKYKVKHWYSNEEE